MPLVPSPIALAPGQWSQARLDEAAPRLDTGLTRCFAGLTRSAAQRRIGEGLVKLNGAVATRASQPLERGDLVELFTPLPRPSALEPEAIPLKILYQDSELAVIEKPAGLVVHPAAGHPDGTLVNALLHHLDSLGSGGGIGGELRPGIVHRIDRNTSGILLVTKTDAAHQSLGRQFHEHSIRRRYLGLCWAELPAEGRWDGPIGRDPKERKRMALHAQGRRALTLFRRERSFAGALSLFEAELHTGRTHQVRVHFSANGFPLAGDSTYGNATRAARTARARARSALARHCPEALLRIDELEARGRQFLHAAELGFTHPVSGERLNFRSALPDELERIVLSLQRCKPVS